MKESRNPFRLRRSESIDTEAAFLTLFEPGILELMPESQLWDSVHILRSAAGGGKTSLLRLFTPPAILALYSRRADDNVKELYQRVKEIGALDDSGPRVLAVQLTCGHGYSMLHDLNIEPVRRDRLFFGLLNARIVLSVLRGALALKGLQFAADLDRLNVGAVNLQYPIQEIRLPCTGRELYEWAEQREASLCRSLDSLGPLRADSLPGDEALTSLALMGPDNLTINDQPVAQNVVLMMDDIQNLTGQQRALLVKTVIDARSPVGIWIAERFEALTTQEMLSSGASSGRDYGETVEIESYWRQRPDRFEKLAIKLADKRVRSAAGTEISSFRSCIQDSLEGSKYDAKFEKIIAQLSDRVRIRCGGRERFQEWIRAREQLVDSPRSCALAWRSLEILIERDLAKKQRSLFDSVPLDEGELDSRDDSSVTNAAELFLAKEFNLPYYFGAERVARLASLNIQQFLGLSAGIFEEAASAELLRNATYLPPERQHELMKAAARTVWNEIPNKVRHGRELRRFLESVGKFAQWYTYRPTAPNDPGVGGTGMRMSERAMLTDEALLSQRKDMRRFADILASALAHNLLVAQLDYGGRKEKWMVLNLNRLLCVHFDLPLNYGLYKERPLSTLCQWLDKPFVAPTSEGTLL